MSTTTDARSAAPSAGSFAPVVRVLGASKTYGPTRALDDVHLEMQAGEIVGVVGHNGAGKSTLMRMLAGLEPADSGSVTVNGQDRPGANGFRGARMAYQETNLFNELSVGENAFVTAREGISRGRWRKQASARIIERLDEIFPGHTIAADQWVGDLTLGQRQMVEIARATLDTDLRLLILDEPTESLTRDTTAKLYAYVAKVAEEGVAVILISHRIQEVLASVDRVVVLKDGHVTSTHPVEGLTEDAVLTAMGGSLAAPVAVTDDTMGMPVEGKGDVVATLAARTARTGDPYEMRIREGEVVGLAGIAGQGQEEILQRLWKGSSRDDKVSASRAFVPGDRQKSGILPLWTVGENLGVTAMRTLSKLGLRDREAEQRTISEWVDALRIKGGADALMTGLSGGNQQKVIVARAFASSAEIVLLDDPFRGVDVHTKTDLYALIRREAANGRTIVWYSSENAEMRHCDRVYVLRAGRVAAELKGNQISEDRIISESFADVSEEAAA